MNDVQKFESAIKKIDLDPNEEIKSMAEMEAEYVDYLKRYDICNFDLGKWIPSLRKATRPLVAGELAIVLADTGTGKTAILQNMAIAAAPLKVLVFEIELPGSLMFERFMSLQTLTSGQSVEDHYKSGGRIDFKLDHIHVCTKSQLDVHQIHDLINLSESKIGQRPAIVMVDYMGLIGGKGNSRYERMSYVAEQLKIVAKATNTIIISACQIHRKGENNTGEIFLHDAKDSGSIENSTGLLIGAWRDGDKGEFMKIKICKVTKGRPGTIITANFVGETLKIYE